MGQSALISLPFIVVDLLSDLAIWVHRISLYRLLKMSENQLMRSFRF